MPKKRLFDLEYIEKEYKNGKSSKDIAEELGVSWSTINRRLTDLGVEKHDKTYKIKEFTKNMRGRNYNEIFGEEKAEEMKRNISCNHADVSGESNPMYGKHHTEETCIKISEGMLGEKHPFFGKPLPLEHRKHIATALTGKIKSAETRNKIAESKRGKHPTEETLKKMSKASTGRKRTLGSIEKTRQALLGKSRSEETKRKISETRKRTGVCKLSNNPNWCGGKSYEPYSLEFNIQLKEKIIERDGHACQICGMTEQQHIQKYGRKLNVHHVDYNKFNNNEINLLTTCSYHNGMMNSDREIWMVHLQEVQERRYKWMIE